MTITSSQIDAQEAQVNAGFALLARLGNLGASVSSSEVRAYQTGYNARRPSLQALFSEGGTTLTIPTLTADGAWGPQTGVTAALWLSAAPPPSRAADMPAWWRSVGAAVSSRRDALLRQIRDWRAAASPPTAPLPPEPPPTPTPPTYPTAPPPPPTSSTTTRNGSVTGSGGGAGGGALLAVGLLAAAAIAWRMRSGGLRGVSAAEERPWRVRDRLSRARYFFETKGEAEEFVQDTSTSEITGEPLTRWADRLVVERNRTAMVKK